MSEQRSTFGRIGQLTAAARSISFGWLFAELLPFADAATKDLPLARLLRLSLFQVSVGMTAVLLTGTLNRVMIVELGISASLVAFMIGLPLVAAPLRALIGFRSDMHKSYLGWRRIPYIWFGSMLQFGGLAIMPFALLLMGSDVPADFIAGQIAAGLAFVLAGAGMHTVQTAGLALATDLADENSRPRVVALLQLMQLAGMVVSALVLGFLLTDFTADQLIQIIQGTALASFLLTWIAVWKQEPRNAALTAHDRERPTFSQAWATFKQRSRPMRLLVSVALGAAGFAMQDVLLEPYGAEVLGLSVGATTTLTAMLAGGSLIGFALSARSLSQGGDPCRIAAIGMMIGVLAFSCVIFAGAAESALLFRIGACLIGLGGGMFGIGTLTAAMTLAQKDDSGLALGVWGAVQATAAGSAVLLGGSIRDIAATLGRDGWVGEGAALSSTAIGYGTVYHIEITLLFAALIAIGPLVHRYRSASPGATAKFGLAELPGQ
jgi:MFS transporter, BCD family, chlorophyll transporter